MDTMIMHGKTYAVCHSPEDIMQFRPDLKSRNDCPQNGCKPLSNGEAFVLDVNGWWMQCFRFHPTLTCGMSLIYAGSCYARPDYVEANEWRQYGPAFLHKYHPISENNVKNVWKYGVLIEVKNEHGKLVRRYAE